MARPSGRALERKRQEQTQERERQKAAQTRRRGIIVALVAVAAVAAVAAFVALQPPPPGIAFPSQGNQHVGAGEAHTPYNSSPPSSGPHMGGLANWGEHSSPVPPELFVHNLEDAGVVLAYDCPDGCPDLLEGLRDLLRRYEGKRVLLTPYTGIVDPQGVPHQAAAVAWTRILYFDSLDSREGRQLRTFINLYEGIDHHVR